ncbi:MAG: TetR/AcrR family transcriptional regulator [Candidatus Aminicenantales bacterium]
MKTKRVLKVSKAGTVEGLPLQARIISASRELFLSRGFVRVTADEIAGCLGISKATLYKSFASKEEILQAVVEEITGEISACIDEILGDGRLGFVEKLVDLFTYVVGRISQFGPLFARDIQKRAPWIWKEIEDFRRDKIEKNLGAIFRAGREQGFFRGDVPMELLLRMFAFLLEEFVNPTAILRSGRTPAETFESVIKVFFQGILTDNGRRDFSARTPALFEPRKEGAT